MEDFLTRYGKEIEAVWCGWDDLGDAAAKAILERGYTRDDMFVDGADGHPHAYNHIRNPKSPFEATVGQKFSYFASITLDLIDKIEVRGMNPDQLIPRGKRIYVDTPLVDPTNVPPEGKLPWPLPWE
jgi:ribose transport system substrate-binding protein